MTSDEPADLLNEQWQRYVAARKEALAARPPRPDRPQRDEIDGPCRRAEPPNC